MLKHYNFVFFFGPKKKKISSPRPTWSTLLSLSTFSSPMWTLLWQTDMLFPFLHGIDVLDMMKVCKFWYFSIQRALPHIRRFISWKTLNHGLDNVNFTSNWYMNGGQSKQLVLLSCVRKAYVKVPWVVQIKMTVSRKKGKPEMEIQFQTMTYPDCLTAATWFDIIACFHAIQHLHRVRTVFYMMPCFQALPYYIKAWILIRYNKDPPPACCWHFENFGKVPPNSVQNALSVPAYPTNKRRKLFLVM